MGAMNWWDVYDFAFGVAVIAVSGWLFGYGVARSLDPDTRRRLRVQIARLYLDTVGWLEGVRPVCLRTARSRALLAYVQGRREGYEEGRKAAISTLSKLRQVPTPIRRRAN